MSQRFKVLSLNDNLPWITAIGNDYDYSDVYRRQLENYAQSGDLMITMSVSGNSPNLVQAAEWAKEQDVKVMAMVGARRGRLAELADHLIVIESEHYGRVEDCHMGICHMLCYAFMELEEGLDGMIHVSDISWTRKINHPSEVFNKNDEIEAVVLEIDKANQRISLGVKQLAVDPWEQIDTLYKVGDLVSGKVTKLASFGAFIGLDQDIDGLVHISQISEERVDKIKNVLEVGQDVTARVIKIDRGDRRIGLSIKAAEYSEEQIEAEQAMLDSLKPGEDLVALQHAFDAADEAVKEDDEPASKD